MEFLKDLEESLLAERGWRFYIGCNPFELYELQLKAEYPDKYKKVKEAGILNMFIYKELILHSPKFKDTFGYSYINKNKQEYIF